ncbi:sensor domain-containing diguanylate cyclase, partial [Persephonella sp.]|uniref:sensor domain-containing diguanylate cyclase n=1 Tax=Persephonella sp. TaxID=2060922 RepID=UPI00260D77C0
NYTAKGYLIEYVKNEINLIRTYIEQSLGNKFLNIKSTIEKHISWEENILEYLAKDVASKKIQIASSSCEMGKWLNNIKTKNKETIKNLYLLHEKLHLTAENIITFKKLEKYTLLLDEYNQFIKQNLLFMSTLITFLFNEEIEELQRDPLTNLLTRRSLESIYFDVMDISLITGEPFGVAFLDIDNFKKINDTYGHDIGDLVLKKIAEILKNTLRRSDYIFRYGGEEFIIIVPATTKNTFYKLLDKIRKRVSQIDIKVDGKPVNVTVSIGGVVIGTKHVVPLSKALKEADNLMYQAKKLGKNKVIVGVLDNST